MNSRNIIAATGIAGVLFFTSACSASEVAPTDGSASASVSAPVTTAPSSPTATEAPNAAPAGSLVLSNTGIISKGIANDGTGNYLQTSIADTDPAMTYNPAITDEAAKAHYSEAELAEAHKVIVRFIAEESIDSTLNGGSTDVDGWYAAHKDQIHPANQTIMFNDLKAGKDDVSREQWITKREGYSYLHGDTTQRISERTITPTQLYYVESSDLRGVMLDTTATWSMKVTGGAHTGIQYTTAEISYSAAIDPADGKWKIAGYDTNYHTVEG